MTFAEWLGGRSEPDRPTKPKTQDAVVGIDRFDREDLAALNAEMREFRLAQDKLCEVAEMGGHLTSDTTMSFFKVGAELEDPADMDPECLVNHAVQAELWKTPEWERLHTWTEGDLTAAGLAFVSIEDHVETILDKCKTKGKEAEDLEKRRQELEEAEAGCTMMEQMVEDWKALGNLTDEELEAMAAMQQAIAEAMAAAAAALAADAAALDQGVASAIAGAMPDMRAALAAEAQRHQDEAALFSAWGLERGELQRIPSTERMRLAERIRKIPDFKRLTDLIGQMKRLAATEQTRKVYHTFEEVYDVGMGNDLGRILPSERLNLIHPATKLDFYRRFSEGKLLEYEMRGDERIGRGGIIACKDDSGSMAGQRNAWAVSVSLAAMAIAKEQKRSFVGLNFGSSWELMEFSFRTEDEYSIDKVIDYAEFFFDGGTDFERPLNRALEILQAEERDKGFVEGDILFITDGACGVTPAWMEKFKAEQERLGFRVWGVMIGANRKSEPLWSICDGQVVTVSDLLSGEEVREIFQGL